MHVTEETLARVPRSELHEVELDEGKLRRASMRQVS
jgi:hypothetical protein